MNVEALAEQLPAVARECKTRLRGWPTWMGDADDATQNTMASLLTADARGRRVPADPPYLRKAAANQATELTRVMYRDQRRREIQLDDPDRPGQTVTDMPGPAGDDPASVITRVDAQRLLAHVFARLTPRHREVLWLRVALGCSAEEVAEMLGLTVGAVRVVQHRALGHARQILARAPQRAGGAR